MNPMNLNLSPVQFLPLREVSGMAAGQYFGNVRGMSEQYYDRVPWYDEHFHARSGEENRRQSELTESVRANGVQTPIIVARDLNRMRIQDGHHRLIAAMETGQTHVPVQFDDYGLRTQRKRGVKPR